MSRFFLLHCTFSERNKINSVVTVEPLLNSHPYQLTSNQSPDEDCAIVFTSIKRPNPFKRPLSNFLRVAV